MAGILPNSLRQDELPEYPFVGPFGGFNSEVSIDKIGRSGFAQIQNVLFRKSQALILPAFVPLSSPSGEPIMGIADFFNVNGVRQFVVWTPTKMYIQVGSGWTQILGASSFAVLGAVTTGTFLANESVTQANTNATGVLVGTVPSGGPMTIVALTGAASATDVWTGVTSLATFTPTTTPTATAALLTGTTSQFFTWDVVGYKLYFSQQKDVVQVWDGLTVYYSPASSVAVPAKYICELDFHLLAANTIETGALGPVPAPNRIHWSGIGDGTDWTSFSAGQADLFNGLGPINGLARIYQYGYAFQQWGITQVVPTGIGTSPFEFISMGSRAKGSILPYGVASFGEIVACYVGKDNIYLFDGTQSNPIGSRPMDGNPRSYVGARARIFADLFGADLTSVSGIIVTSVNGYDYESYWLFIPSLNKAWIYHFDEQNWTQIFFNTGQLVGPAGIFFTPSGEPRIEDLVGTIAAQTWSPDTLTNTNALDTFAISDANANSVSLLNFNTPGTAPTSGSINANDGWYIKSGQLEFDDPRHNHAMKSVRVSMIDYSAITVSFRFTNEFGQQATWPVADGSNATTNVYSLTYGTGSGATLKMIIPVALQGKYITWEMSGPQGVGWGMSEITPIFDVGGETQNNR
jgi:hypothetical protein